MKRHTLQSGFGLLELLVAIFIVSLIGVGVSRFQSTLFREFYRWQAALRADGEARSALKNLLTELRSAGPADNGAYALQVAGPTELVFFSDGNRDGRREQIRYRVEGESLRRGVVHSTGNPAVYNQGSETFTVAASALANPTQVFSYYDASFAGTSTPLTLPINLPTVRLIQARLELKLNNASSSPLIYQGRATLRSLKDNL